MNGLLIGRFQPFHLGHIDAIKFALTKVEKLWLGIGSSNKSPEKENPFSADERKEMILNSLEPEILQNIEIFYIPDLDDHKKWIENLDTIVPTYEVVFSNDEMTRHLYSKREIPVVQIPFTNRNHLSGTNIRKKIISDQNWHD
ncbi:MAG: nicotinamide-nucleotide adenylyltransferase, partial [Nitrosopumilaceae archaeon]|nr:nicotinamide-nucleotide adenylyltransferase [Nitrosopumilaceae archaeon]